MLAVLGVCIVSFPRTGLTGPGRHFAQSDQFRGENPCWDDDQAVAQNHDEHRQHLSSRRQRDRVAVAGAGDGGQCPVDALWDGGEAVFRPLDEVHERSRYEPENGDGEEEDDDACS